MKAKLIIDDVMTVPHPFVFRGVEYDLQKSFAVTREIKLFLDDEDANELDVALVALAAMMRDSDIRAGIEREPVTVDQLAAYIAPEQYEQVMKYVNSILVPDSDKEDADTSELDAIVDENLPESVKN